MAVTPASIKAQFKPNFDSLDDSFILIKIEEAKLMVNRAAFGNKYDLAVSYMTAHLLELSTRGGNVGIISSEKVGDLSRSFSASASDPGEASLGETAYGKFFLSLRKTIPKSPLTWS